MTRYVRQIQLPDVGDEGQARIARARVLVVGAGGLGSPVLSYLAGAGVGHLTILDPDHVEESNLHRQPMFRMSDIGRTKAVAAAEAIRALNPEVMVDAQTCALNPANAPRVVEEADVVIDAADSFAVSYCLSDACLATRTPLISASALGQTGYVGGFCGGAPSLRAVFPDLPQSGATCATAGVLGPVVGTVGAIQAQMALRLILASDPSPLGHVVSVDLARFQFGGFDFANSPEPVHSFSFLSKDMLKADDLVIELRDVAEVADPIVPAAVRMTSDMLDDLQETKGRRVVLCCHSGLRAWRAASQLQSRGFGSLAVMAAVACS
ncbi:ThiF family adenylyltransferase [Shimia thalassica]|uniref:ThiF family adenylyltransferase n=1 Tax=Shimia thalassica TaxID=1715693 RepID=UPI001C08405E|nr:ThiF family adenylyltransferase [Shimia thalassica]MBU2943581.1 ThiF family adenylyltransferase [Shimia thalassica]MDO6501651.1 ThiF family adenylyltransferase [Shimia thalassica]